MTTRINKITLIAAAFLIAATASGQSRGFTFGKWSEIQNAIIQELNRSYVDTLPIDRIQRAAIDAMLGELDPYTVFVAEEEEEDFQMMIGKTYGGIGAVIYKPEKDGNVIINEPYENSPAHKNSLCCGDEIMAIDGVSVNGLDSKECSERMKGKPGTSVVFKVKKLRTGTVEDITVVRERIHLPDVEYYGMIDDTTGYIYQTGFTDNVSSEVREAVCDLKSKGMKRLFLDLRGNGGGLLQEAVNIVSLFVPRGSTVVTAKGSGNDAIYNTSTEPLDTELPLFVLVDSGTASASEIIAGALQDLDRAVILGRRTFGKGLVQGIRPLPYNCKLKVTTAKYYTPSGRCVQAIDYSQRNEDGSVGHIPDSLTREFKTLHGRTVRDGGGITPDRELSPIQYSRLTYSLVLNGIVEQYALEYVRTHESIPPVEDFHIDDVSYAEFVKFAASKTFDYRSGAKTYFDQMKKELEEDGLADSMSSELNALDKALEMDKEQFLNLKKDEIIQFLEEEIAIRYYFQKAGVEIRLRYDNQLKEALI